MMSNDFDRAFGIVVGHEGGYVNDPQDPGGETNYGISKRAHPDVDIANLTLDGAKAIYRGDYWAQCRCAELPWPLNLYVFDAAVNQGVTVAIKLLQKAVDVAQDGIIGKRTVRAAAGAPDWHIDRFMAFRAKRYFGTRNFDRFGDGWLIRTYAVARQGEKA